MIVNSNTTPDELERLLFVVNPDCHALFGENVEILADLEAERDKLLDKVTDLEQEIERRDTEPSHEALIELLQLIDDTPRVPKELRKAIAEIMKGVLYP